MKTTSRAYYIAAALVTVFSLVSGFLPKPVLAADIKAGPDDRWLDKTTVVYKGVTYVDPDIFVSTDNMHYSTKSNGVDSNNVACADTLDVKDQNNWGNLTLQKMKTSTDSNGKITCVNDGSSVKITGFNDVANSQINAYQVDVDHIYMPQYNEAQATRTSGKRILKNQGLFTRVANSKCAGHITGTNGIDKGKCTFFSIGSDTVASGGVLGQPLVQIPAIRIDVSNMTQNATNCITVPTHCASVNDGKGYKIGFAEGRKVGAVPDPLTGYKVEDANTGIDGSSGGDKGQPTCESSGWSLSWIFCPVINGLASTVDSIFTNFVQPSLQTDSIDFTNPTGKIFQVWASFRNIANILLIIAMLVVVFGQSIGGGMIDAYTAKKVIPRIVAAAILLNLSIYLVALAIDVTNVLGRGISGLIYTPFGSENWHFKLSGAGSALGIGSLATGIFALFVGGTAILSFLALFILLPAFLAGLGVFVTIIIRQGLIVFLVISSPIAFVLYCLPNTDKYFKQWWSLLLKTLLVYPIIMIVFAVTDVLAVTIGNSSTSTNNTSPVGWMTNIVTMILLVLPMFLIPWSFKMAGGAIGSLSGMLQGMGKKATEGIKGNPNDPGSLRRRTANNAKDTLRNRRGNLNSVLRGRARNPVTRFGARVIGGGAPQAAMDAVRNSEEAQRIGNTWAHGDDTYARGATIPIRSMRQWRAGAAVNADGSAEGHRYRRDANGREEFESADGKWLTPDLIREGHRAYSGHNAMQENYSQLLTKTEALTPEHQGRVLEDFVQWSNDEGIAAGPATGRWQGIAIPHKGMRMDQRRAQITGTPGNLAVTGVDHRGLATEFANAKPYELVGETEGTFDAVAESIRQSAEVVGPPAPVTDANGNVIPGAQHEPFVDEGVNAYNNLKRFVEGTGTPQAVQQLQQQAAAQAAAGAGAGPAAGYSPSSGAAAKNAAAAAEALATIDNDPALLNYLRNNGAI